MKKTLIAAIVLALALLLTACDSSDYKRAEEYLSSNKYDVAIEMFESLGDYKNSADRANEARFAKADVALAAGQFDDAIEMFTALGEYPNAAEKVCEATYKKAEQMIAEERLEKALEIFLSLGNYNDASNRVAEVEEMMKIHATAVTLNKSKLSLTTGKTAVLSATMEPSDTTDVIENWKSSDEAIAEVNSEGKITAKKEGTAVITVETSNGLSAECTVTVSKPVVASKPASEPAATSKPAAKPNISAEDSAKAKAAYASLKGALKFPETLKIYNVWAFDLNSYTKIEIEYSAENNYGQSVRKFFNATFEGNALILTKTTADNPINNSGFLGSNVRNLGVGSVY